MCVGRLLELRERQHAQRDRAAAAEELRGVAVGEQQRRRVAGVDPAQLLGDRVDDHVDQRGHLALLLLGPDQPVELLDDTRRGVALERVGAQRAAQAADHGGRREALAGHVAHHQPDAAARGRQHVVPVAADLGLGRRGQVASRHRQPRQLRQVLRQQAALERLGDPVLALVHARVIHRERDAVGGQPQQAHVVRAEVARRGRADDQHAGDLALGQQRQADHGVDLQGLELGDRAARRARGPGAASARAAPPRVRQSPRRTAVDPPAARASRRPRRRPESGRGPRQGRSMRRRRRARCARASRGRTRCRPACGARAPRPPAAACR